jgi:tetratricopeptide (TPR) repeat protein
MWVAYEQLCELGVFDLSPELAFASAGRDDIVTTNDADSSSSITMPPTKIAKSSLFDSASNSGGGGGSLASNAVATIVTPAAAADTPRTGVRGSFLPESSSPDVNPAAALDFSNAGDTPMVGSLAFETPSPVPHFAISNEPPPMTGKARNNSQRGSSAGDSVATTAVRRTLVTSAPFTGASVPPTRLTFSQSPADPWADSDSGTPSTPMNSSPVFAKPSLPAKIQQQQQQQQQAFALPSLHVMAEVVAIEPPQNLSALLTALGLVYRSLCQYNCRETLKRVAALPRSPWTLRVRGRAHFELVEYEQAADSFEAMRRAAPYLTQGVEFYSTTLWHLKRASDLSELAQATTALNKWSPQAWCAVGNCFSLAREVCALRFFRRATQVDPHFAYAHTLAGHEAVANDDSEGAINHYRQALRIDSRHYNAWYGIGTVFYREEKFEMAEYHFRRALAINPNSSVLHSYVGMAAQARGRLNEARACLDRAVQLAPNNTMARFKRASVTASLGRIEQAIEQLEQLRDTLPREAPVYYLLGQLYAHQGRYAAAIGMMRVALDLAPRHSNYIRSTLEKLEAKLTTDAAPDSGAGAAGASDLFGATVVEVGDGLDMGDALLAI